MHFDILESLTWRDSQQPSVAPADIVNTLAGDVRPGNTNTHTDTHKRKYRIMYVSMLDDNMTVLACSQTSNVMPKRREQDNVSARCHCNTVQGRGAACTQVEEGVCVWGGGLFVC